MSLTAAKALRAVVENKDIADIDDNIRTTITSATQSTSNGYSVDEPDNSAGSGVTGQTTPPYNPNNSAEVTEPALETEIYD